MASTTESQPLVIESDDEEMNQPTRSDTSNDGDLYIIEQKGGSAFEKSLEQIHLFPRSPSNNITDFLNKIEMRLRKRMKKLVKVHQGLKAYLTVELDYDNPKEPNKTFSTFLTTRNLILGSEVDLIQFINEVREEVFIRNERYIRDKSGLVINSINKATLNVQEYQHLVGGSCPTTTIPRKEKGNCERQE